MPGKEDAREPLESAEDDSFRWTAPRLITTLLGGWIALGLLALFLHVMLGGFRTIDLGLLLLAIVWGLVLVFAGIEDRCSRH